jgi:hypothetical protein
MSTIERIADLELELEEARDAYLRKHGWKRGCSTPGAYVLWRRDFSDIDAERLNEWMTSPPGPYGKSSKPAPFGVITADTDLAVSMTQKAVLYHGLTPHSERAHD